MTSALYKDWVVGGRTDLTPEQRTELLSRVHLDWQRAPHAKALNISYAPTSGHFYVSDSEGPLCATDNVEALIMLIVAEGLHNMTASRMLGNQPGAPHQELAPDADPDVKSRARDLANRMRDRMAAGPAGTPGSGTEVTIKDGSRVRTMGQE